MTLPAENNFFQQTVENIEDMSREYS